MSGMTQTKFRVDGMDCASCASKIDTAVRRMPGISEVAVSVTAGTMTVTHDDTSDLDAMSRKLSGLGYKATPIQPRSAPVPAQPTEHSHGAGGGHEDHDHEPGEHDDSSATPAPAAATDGQARYRVGGMDCASCATKVETAVRRMPGIEDVSVSVASGTMSVKHSAVANLKAVEKQVSALGYSIAPIIKTPKPTSPGSNVSSDHSGHDHGPGSDHAEIEGLHGRDHGPSEGPWWKSKKGRLTIMAGTALVLAYGIGHLFPAIATYAFLIAMLVGLVPIGRRAIMAAMAGTPFSIEMLMTIAAIGALIIDATEEAAAVVFLFLVGELLEGVAAGKARDSIKSLTALVPKTALLEEGGKTREVPAETLAVGSVILVRPGDRISADGVIVAGESSIDEAPVTGESVPVRKVVDDSVFAGTVNGDWTSPSKVEGFC